jgi:hypothetical protein
LPNLLRGPVESKANSCPSLISKISPTMSAGGGNPRF